MNGEIKALEEYTYRLARVEDIPQIISCVKQEYGQSYYRRDFYNPKDLEKYIERKNLFVVSDGPNLCGIQSMIDHKPEDDFIEGASQIFFKKYRGLGLPKKLVKYTYDIAKNMDYSCIYATAVTFHKITQRMCEKEGMVPVGFNFGSYITALMNNSFQLGKSEKYIQAILVLPVQKRDAKTIYVDSKTKSLAEYVYGNLKVDYKISTEEKKPQQKESVIKEKINQREQELFIRVEEIGEDLVIRVKDLMKSYQGDLWTVQIILLCDCRESIWAQQELKKEGFFVAGFRPLCNKREQIYLQHIGDVKFCIEELDLTDGFRDLINRIVELKEL